MSWFVTNLLSAILMPPLNLLLLAAAGFFICRWRPRLGRTLLGTALALLWICSTPIVSGTAISWLAAPFKTVDIKAQAADVIVVLGAGSYLNAPEYGEDTVGDQTLVRLRYAAKLQRDSGKPILVSGGKPVAQDLSEAAQMKAVLEHELSAPVRWTEDASSNTFENARYSKQILEKENIKRIYLVTHTSHMRRAVMVFRNAGFDVVPAPTLLPNGGTLDIFSFIPSAGALYGSHIFMHELIGMAWYRYKILRQN